MVDLKQFSECSIQQINRAFRQDDESHLWPISGRFNATERAIRRLRRAGVDIQGYEYAACLDAEISRVVNEAVG